MSIEVSRLPLKELWNSEYTIFVDQVITISKKYNIQQLHLTKSLARITAFSDSLAKMTAQEKSNELSQKLNELDIERDNLVNGIIAQVKTMSKITIPNLATNAAILVRLFDKHGRDMATVGYNPETKRIKDLLSDYNTNSDVKAAAEVISVKILFEQLIPVNNQFETLFLERNQQYSDEDTIDARALRNEIDKAIVAYFDAIVFCSGEYDDQDYNPLVNELNQNTNYYKAQLKARVTRRANANESKDKSATN